MSLSNMQRKRKWNIELTKFSFGYHMIVRDSVNYSVLYYGWGAVEQHVETIKQLIKG